MARKVTWGTPSRTEHYVNPRRAWAFMIPAGIVGVACAVLYLLFQLAGYRTPLSPGGVISGHAPHEARCEECHAPRQGASNLRCQRCHDPAAGNRLSQTSHVFFGSRDAKKAAAAQNLACARCHVEHRGRAARLSRVDETHCLQCHFRSLNAHPEFAVLQQKSAEAPGLRFTHDRHVKEVTKQTGAPTWQTCVRCHESTPRGLDLDPVSFDRHCASCHAKGGSLGVVDPITQEDVLAPEAILARGVRGDWLQRTEEYDVSRGRVSRSAVSHRDPWVLYNLRKLRRELDPGGFEAERGALLARLSQLKRRLALSAPLAGLDAAALRAREALVMAELRGLERRIESQSKAAAPSAGLSRLEDVMAAAAATGDTGAGQELQELKGQAESLKGASGPPGPIPPDEFDARRRELLAALEAIEAADAALKPRAEDLRRRLLALSPGESGLDVLKRVRDQRSSDVERVRDEIRLRDAGVEPPRVALLAGGQRAIQKAVADTQAELDAFAQAPEPTRPPSDDERARKQESSSVLAATCLKCHILKEASLARVVAARSVMVRATFVHAPHLLQADCARCHDGVEKSKASQDLNFKGVQSCRECHRPRAVTTDCQACHNYHPPVGL